MFEKLDQIQKSLVYHGLKLIVEKGEGLGFHNRDRGHPAYAIPASGKTTDDTDWGDGPDRNDLFKMLKSLSDDLRGTVFAKEVGWYDFTDWQKFCKFAVDCHNK